MLVNAIDCDVYERANAWEKGHRSSDAAHLLGRGANLCFENAKRDLSHEECMNYCNMLIEDLCKASEKDGIGMYWDDEWIYEQVQAEIKKFIYSQK